MILCSVGLCGMTPPQVLESSGYLVGIGIESSEPRFGMRLSNGFRENEVGLWLLPASGMIRYQMSWGQASKPNCKSGTPRALAHTYAPRWCPAMVMYRRKLYRRSTTTRRRGSQWSDRDGKFGSNGSNRPDKSANASSNSIAVNDFWHAAVFFKKKSHPFPFRMRPSGVPLHAPTPLLPLSFPTGCDVTWRRLEKTKHYFELL